MGGEDAIVRVTTRESAETAGPGRPRPPRGDGDRDRQRTRRSGRQRGEREGGEGQRNGAPRSQDQPRNDNRGNRQDPRGDQAPRGNQGRGKQRNEQRDEPRGEQRNEQRDEPRGEQRNQQRDEPRGEQRNQQRDEPRGEQRNQQRNEQRDPRSGPRPRGGGDGGRSGDRDSGGRDSGNRDERRGREPRNLSTINAVDPADEIRVPGVPSDLPAAIKSDPEDEVDLFGSTLRDLLVILGLSETSITARDPETAGDGVGLISQVFDVFGENDEVSDELAVLIGRRGETLNALQYLLNVLVSKHSDGDLIFSVDIEGYRSRRERTLVDMAHEIAAEVRATGDVITLEPMPAAERRIIHLTLESEEGVTTESVGRATDRQVEVMPD